AAARQGAADRQPRPRPRRARRRPGRRLPPGRRGDPPRAPGRRPARLRDRHRRHQRPGAGAGRVRRAEAVRGDGMTCAFELAHYRELLQAAKAGGYRFAFFDRPPERWTVLLRHDVDLSLDAALATAELEAEAGAVATYFLMTRSEFY